MRITAGGAVIQGGLILLGRRRADGNYYPDCWDIFGDHCEAGETPEETLERELHEELGIRPSMYSLIGVYHEPHPELYGDGKHYFFAVTDWSGEPGNRSIEHVEIRWFRFDDLKNVTLASEKHLGLFRPLL